MTAVGDGRLVVDGPQQWKEDAGHGQHRADYRREKGVRGLNGNRKNIIKILKIGSLYYIVLRLITFHLKTSKENFIC